MNQLEERKRALIEELKNLQAEKKRMDERHAAISTELKDKTYLYNQLISTIAALKKDYKENLKSFSNFKNLIKEYKTEQKKRIEIEFYKKIKEVVSEINLLQIEFKLSVFKVFDKIKSAETDLFPILESKKRAFLKFHKNWLKKEIFDKIASAVTEKSKINDLIFYISFMIRYEIYFLEAVFVDFLKMQIVERFKYHFMSDRESNRLDKPEWYFDFLVKNYEDSEAIFEIYNSCAARLGAEKKHVSELIEKTQSLVFTKLKELSKCSSPQKRNLIFHFVSMFRTYSSRLKTTYGFTADSKDVSYVLTSLMSDFVVSELSRIHEMKCVQWFDEYKMLCHESMIYLHRFGDFDSSFRLEDLIEAILTHLRHLLENFRFINRDEIKLAGFIFSKLEELKEYILNEESELLLISQPTHSEDFSSKSLEAISEMNSEILRLIKKLALNDIEVNFKKIQYFNYSSVENRRTFQVNISKIMEEYKQCVYFDVIEKYFMENLDSLIAGEILFKIKFSSDEFGEFKEFYKTLKGLFNRNSGVEQNWRSDQVCRAIEAALKGTTLKGKTYEKIAQLYTES